jgi:sialate O-acetylesterase
MHSRKRLAAVLLAGLAWLSAPAALADVKPHTLFSHGMVLQQGMKVPVWGTADDGEKITLTIEGRVKENVFLNHSVKTEATKGNWRVVLPEMAAGGPFTMTILGKNSITLKDVYVGEVWICSGQSNMQWPVNQGGGNVKEVVATSKNPKIRLLTVPRKPADKPQTDLQAKWEECGPATVGGFSAVGYYFGRDLQKALNVPVGLISSNQGGTAAERWTSLAVLEKLPESKGKDKGEATLYNAMIAPLVPYAFKGVIWYQGESNASRHDQYEKLLSAMIKNWRDDWKQGDFPFLIVQLAPFMKIEKEPTDTPWARLREAQRQVSLKVPHTAQVVITDAGDEKDIHPKPKEPVGARLALAALALVYGRQVEHSGPAYDSLKVEGDKAVLSFKHIVGGLEAKGGSLTGFTIAGEDRKFYNAEAEIRGDKVVVWSDQVPKPVAVRFGWANYPVVNLWNKAGLPASPFRTDDWPLDAPAKK